MLKTKDYIKQQIEQIKWRMRDVEAAFLKNTEERDIIEAERMELGKAMDEYEKDLRILEADFDKVT